MTEHNAVQLPGRIDFVSIETNEALAGACESWQSQSTLYIDTEFERTRTFYAIAALLQVSDGQRNYLIDPVTISDFSPFAALWENPSIVKVLHSASEDIEVLSRLTGKPPQSLFDTQIAAALVGLGHGLGYSALVDRVTDIHLPKQETRSDWLKRPLSDAQLQYAALDIEFLPVLYETLNAKLEKHQRTSWLMAECEMLQLKHGTEPHEHGEAYKKISQAWRLDTQHLAVLRALCSWRENEARRRDRPRSHIVTDEVLNALARHSPKTVEEMSDIAEVGANLRKRNGATLLRLIEQSLQLEEHQLPDKITPPSDLRPFNSTLKALKSVVVHCATEYVMAPEILASRRTLEALVRHFLSGQCGLTDHFQGWRSTVVGEKLLQTLHNRHPSEV